MKPKQIAKSVTNHTTEEAKDNRFIRHGKVLDGFLLRHYQAAGYSSPNEFVVGLIRQEMQQREGLAKAA